MISTATKQLSTVNQLIDLSAESYGDKTFIKYCSGNEVIEKSYNTVRNDSYAVCRFIRSISEEPMHIAVMGKTNYEYITVITGVLLSGSIVIPLAPDLTEEETAFILNHSDTDMIFAEGDVTGALKQCPRVKKCVHLGDSEAFADLYKAYDENGDFSHLSDFEPDPDAPALIMYTSGTTGDRKGVMLSMRALVSNTDFKELAFTPEDVTLSVLPMHHIFCFSSDYLKNIKDGVSVCLNGDISNIESNLLRFEPTIIRLVPVMIKSLLRKTRFILTRNPELTPRQAADRVFGRRLRWITSAGAYLNPSVIREFEGMGIKIRQAYGMTEAGPRISVPDSGTSPESVGRIISVCEVRIQKGEIQVSSPSLMMGYYKDPEATAQAFTDDGWLRTGDMGRVTEDNQLFITGRLKNLIILSNGENVSPEEIEKKFAEEPLVKEILVYEKNDRIAADIFPDYDYARVNGIEDIQAELTQIINRINARDVSTREIITFRILSEPLPRTESGKVKRNTVRIENN